MDFSAIYREVTVFYKGVPAHIKGITAHYIGITAHNKGTILFHEAGTAHYMVVLVLY